MKLVIKIRINERQIWVCTLFLNNNFKLFTYIHNGANYPYIHISEIQCDRVPKPQKRNDFWHETCETNERSLKTCFNIPSAEPVSFI